MDARIGKRGEYKPTFTIRGLPVAGQVTETRELGNGYYCIVNGTGSDIDGLIKELKESIPNESKRKPAKDKKHGETDNSL
jgi:hypothetical protein